MTTDPPLIAALSPVPSSHRTIAGVEVRLLELPIRQALVASHGSHSVRRLTVVRLTTGPESSAPEGWGECAALPTRGYWPETADSSFDILTSWAPGLLGRTVIGIAEEMQSPSPTTTKFPMAGAALEMAAIDLALRGGGISLPTAIGVNTKTVPAGSVIGIGQPEAMAEQAAAFHDQGFRRFKLKIEPGHEHGAVAAVFRRFDGSPSRHDIAVHVDANGAYNPGAEHLDILVGLAELGVEVIEQPFAPTQLEPARLLRRRLLEGGYSTRVFADEAATSVDQAVESVADGSADGVIIKPSRLGGIGQALQLIEQAKQHGFPVAVGGMLESGLGRHALAAVAAAAHDSGTTVTGDLSPARHWLATDPWDDIQMAEMTEPSDGGGPAEIEVPRISGVAPEPDQTLLDRLTTRLWRRGYG